MLKQPQQQTVNRRPDAEQTTTLLTRAAAAAAAAYKSPILSDTYVLLLPLHCGRSTSRSRSGSLGGAR